MCGAAIVNSEQCGVECSVCTDCFRVGNMRERVFLNARNRKERERERETSNNSSPFIRVYIRAFGK